MVIIKTHHNVAAPSRCCFFCWSNHLFSIRFIVIISIIMVIIIIIMAITSIIMVIISIIMVSSAFIKMLQVVRAGFDLSSISSCNGGNPDPPCGNPSFSLFSFSFFPFHSFLFNMATITSIILSGLLGAERRGFGCPRIPLHLHPMDLSLCVLSR